MDEGELNPAFRLLLAGMIIFTLVFGGFLLLYSWYLLVPFAFAGVAAVVIWRRFFSTPR